MSDRSEEDITARAPTMRRDEAYGLAADFIRYGTKCGALDAAEFIKKRADEIEAEGSASIFSVL